MDLRAKIMLEELYNAGDFDFILENYDSKTLLKVYSFTNGNILLDEIRKKYDKLAFLKALGKKIDDLDIVMYLEGLGHHFVVNNSPLLKKFNRRDLSELMEQEDSVFSEDDQEIVDEIYTLFGHNENYDVLFFLEKVFYESLQVEPEMARNDFMLLLEIKRRYPSFNIIIDPSIGNVYCKDSGAMGSIVLKDENVLAFNHELVHAIQRYKRIDSFSSPRFTMIKKDGAVEKLYEVAKDYKLDKEIVQQKYQEYIEALGGIETYKKGIENDFKNMFGTEDLLRNVLTSIKRPKELLDYVYDAFVNKKKYKADIDTQKHMEEYVKYHLEVEFEYFKRELYQIMYGEFLIFQNFVDAYMNGTLYDYYIHHNYHKGVYSVSVHTEKYFKNSPSSRFSEMLADYIALKKSPKGAILIEHLRDIIGSEYIEYLDEYYMNISNLSHDNKRSVRAV